MIRTNLQSSVGRGRYYSRYVAHFTKKNYPLLVLGGLFVAGVLIGTLLLRSAKSETLEFLMRMVNGFVDTRRQQSMLDNFLSGLSTSMVFVALLFIGGFCAISHPLIVAIPLFRGLGVGFSMASLYASYGSRAIGYVGLLMMPGTLLTMLAIILCCRESLRLAGSFFAAMGGEGQKGEFYPLRIYLARYFACTALCAASAFLESVLHFGFANSFNFG